MEMSFVGVVKSFSFRIESTPTTYECPLIRGSFTLQKRRFKLQSDMYIICNVPSQYIFSTGSGNQNLHVYHHGSRHPGWKTRGFRCPQVEPPCLCRGRLVERTRPRPAPRSEWNFPREFVANGGVVVWTKKVRAELPGAWQFEMLFFWLVVIIGFIQFAVCACSFPFFVVFYLL